MNSIIENILGGLITSALVLLLSWLRKRYKSHKIKRILGKDSLDEGIYYLVYPQFELEKSCINFQSPPYAIGNAGTSVNSDIYEAFSCPAYQCSPSGYDNTNVSPPPDSEYFFKHWSSKNKSKPVSIQNAISNCDVRGLSYIISNLMSNLKCKSFINSDFELKNKHDFSMVCIGGSTAEFFDIIDNAGVRDKVNHYNNVMMTDTKYDYGFIIKTSPANCEGRVWLTCFGIGEWGTSGAAWFLANKHNELYDKIYAWTYDFNSYPVDPFWAIIKTEREKDETAVLVDSSSTRISLKEMIIAILKKI
jgi:hypothetical protein